MHIDKSLIGKIHSIDIEKNVITLLRKVDVYDEREIYIVRYLDFYKIYDKNTYETLLSNLKEEIKNSKESNNLKEKVDAVRYFINGTTQAKINIRRKIWIPKVCKLRDDLGDRITMLYESENEVLCFESEEKCKEYVMSKKS